MNVDYKINKKQLLRDLKVLLLDSSKPSTAQLAGVTKDKWNELFNSFIEMVGSVAICSVDSELARMSEAEAFDYLYESAFIEFNKSNLN